MTSPGLLMIEDDSPTALAMKGLLHHYAIPDVRWASSIADARALIRDRSPNVVMLDLMMPDGDGESIIDEIRTRCPAARVIVVTALPEGSARLRTVASLKPDAIIHKPYEIEGLMAAVKGGATVAPPAAPATTSPPKGNP